MCLCVCACPGVPWMCNPSESFSKEINTRGTGVRGGGQIYHHRLSVSLLQKQGNTIHDRLHCIRLNFHCSPTALFYSIDGTLPINMIKRKKKYTLYKLHLCIWSNSLCFHRFCQQTKAHCHTLTHTRTRTHKHTHTHTIHTHKFL